MRRLRWVAACAAALAAGIALALAVAPAGAVGPEFADWTAVSNNTATGTLLGNPITLSGTHVSDPPGSTVNGTSILFSDPEFTPSFPSTDAIEIRGSSPAFGYTIQFGAPIQNPTLDIGSLGSALDFPAGTSITRVSGTSGFAVSGTTVTGAPDNNVDPSGENDSWGTVMLNGTFQTITFTALYPGVDGVYIQVGANAPPPPPPTTTTTTTTTTPPTPTTPPTTTTTPTPPTPLPRYREVDIRVSGIEVTQAIQWSGCPGCEGTLPSRSPVKSLRGVVPASFASYQGARMAAGHFTVVRVFATFTRPADRATLSGVTAKLDLIDSNGTVLETLTPDSGPATLTKTECWTCVTLAQRANAGGSFNFLVPWQETFHRQLSFRATVNPIRYAQALLPVVQCSGCHANVFTLTGVPFVQTADVAIHPIPLTVNGIRTSMNENQVFGSAQTVLPVNVQIFRYEANLPVSDMGANVAAVSSAAAAAVARRAGQDRYTNSQFAIGVFQNHIGTDLLGGLTTNRLFGTGPAISIVRDNRPLTSVMHEIGHGLGLSHADTGSYVPPPVNDNTGPHPDGTPDCGGNSNGQPGETWPPDNEGLITATPVDEGGVAPTGAGLDRRNWDIFRTGSLPRPVIQGLPDPGDLYYDFMSYCGRFPNDATFESNHWISVRNWNQLVDFHPPSQTLPRATDRTPHQTDNNPVQVLATVDPSGATSIFDVIPGQRSTGAPTPGSAYRIELRDASGSMLASAVPSTQVIHIDGERPGMLLDATLPFLPGAANVTVTLNGRALTTRTRSPHTPTVRILTPRPGARLGHTKTTLIRWRANDADNDHLSATITYSSDAGRHWKVIADQPKRSSVRVPSRMLSATRNGSIRVAVSDGFNLATATAARLRATGAPPLVRITGTSHSETIRTDQTLLLQGTAFDDADHPLTGRRLKWYAVTRLIGRGELLTVNRLPPGTNRIRLVATDSHGRTSQAVLRINVLALRPLLTVVRAPASVGRRARALKITVASNVPAVFTIAGVRHQVNPKPRTITIGIRPGRSTLRLNYSLSSPGGVTRGTYIVSR